MRRLWGRLSLRWQAAIAILAPCTAVAIVACLYFPPRLNTQAEQALLSRGRTLGALAAAATAPTLKLIGDGLSRPQDLDHVFVGALGGEDRLEATDVLWLAVLKAPGPVVQVSPQALVRQMVQKRAAETFAAAQLDVPRQAGRNGCVIDDGENLLIRCFVKDTADDALEGLFVAAIDKTGLRAEQRGNLLVGFWSAGGTILAALLLAFFFSGALSEPVRRMTGAARTVAAGDVTVRPVEVDEGTAVELSSMARSFNEMLASLRALVSQMVELTGQLGRASQELTQASTEQGVLSQKQAGYTQEIAATFEELARVADGISTSSDTVDAHARRTHEAVDSAREVFAQLVGDIGATRIESQTVSDSIQALNNELKQVSTIAQLINAFADRSDLLALNAALEGTRVGELGHGFSLVADEWRRLSESVAGSARDIERIIDKVQTMGGTALSQARAGVATSDKRVTIAADAAKKFEEIFARVRGTTDAAQQISGASREQRRTSEEAANGARNVSDMVKRGVEATQRTQEIAEQLRKVSAQLEQLTKRFRV